MPISRIDLCLDLTIVGAQFVTIPRQYWARTKKALTISFVKSGLQRYDLGHR